MVTVSSREAGRLENQNEQVVVHLAEGRLRDLQIIKSNFTLYFLDPKWLSSSPGKIMKILDRLSKNKTNSWKRG